MQQKTPALAGWGYMGYASRVFFDYPLQCAHTLKESFIFPLFLSSMSLMNFMSTAAVCSSIMSHSKANYFHSIEPENKSSVSNQGSLPNLWVLFKSRTG